MYDLVIRNGRVVDGSGMPAFNADIAVQDGRITRIGRVAEAGRREIDATAKVVAPGFIDPHTHFDAQLLWDGYAKPALSHGVTTVVAGNCSLSLAPLKAEHRMKLVGLGELPRISCAYPKGACDQCRPAGRTQRVAPVGNGRSRYGTDRQCAGNIGDATIAARMP